MLLVGSDDGVYRTTSGSGGIREVTKTLDSGRVMRLRQFETGTFAATTTGLYRSHDGRQWDDLGCPETKVYAVGTDDGGDSLYAGTRPARVYRMPIAKNSDSVGERGNWTECEGFQELPSRETWRLPRHENLAQVRDVCGDPADQDRIVAGVEVGGVHVSPDGGKLWVDRSEGVHDDIHDLHVVDRGSYVTATGEGLYQTHDAGRSWDRLDRSIEQSYFRRVFSIGDVIYASGARSNSSTWNDADAEPVLVRWRSEAESVEPIDSPSGAVVTGMTALDGALVVATHRGGLFVRTEDGWTEYGTVPVRGSVTGRYTPVTSIDE